ncbi:MAG: SDR family oxidoreductase [Rhodothermales bacterium]|nr:SDR family oxidoreductase [Rhodothermales bacterium]
MPTALVVGATGNVGSRLVPHLARRGHTVRAATRDPDAYDGADAEPVRFDYDDRATWPAALDGADHLFLIPKNADPEPEQTLIPFLDAAEEAGVERVVLMTAVGVENTERGLRTVEEHLDGLSVDATILRPNWFMQNFYPGWLYPMIQHGGTITLPAGEARTAFVDAEDIAEMAAAVLTEDGHAGAAYTVSGPEALTYGEAAAVLSDASGRTITYQSVPDSAMREALADQGWYDEQAELMADLFAAVRQNYAAETGGDVEHVLGRPPRSLRRYAEAHADAFRA